MAYELVIAVVGRDGGGVLEESGEGSGSKRSAEGAKGSGGAEAGERAAALGLVGVMGAEEEARRRRRSMPWHVTMCESEGGQMSGWMM